MSVMFVIAFQVTSFSSAKAFSAVVAPTKFHSICEVVSKRPAGKVAFSGVIIADDEHFNILKSPSCPSVSIPYALDVDRIAASSPLFWERYAPASPFNVGLQVYCVKATGKLVETEDGEYFSIQSVASFKKIKMQAAPSSFNVARIKCPD